MADEGALLLAGPDALSVRGLANVLSEIRGAVPPIIGVTIGELASNAPLPVAEDQPDMRLAVIHVGRETHLLPRVLMHHRLSAKRVPTIVVADHLDGHITRIRRVGLIQGVVSTCRVEAELPLAVQVLGLGQEWLSECLARIDDEGPQFSIREVEALQLYLEGKKIVTIARQMNVQESTVKTYLARIRRKYADRGVPASSRLELLKQAQADGIL